MSLQMRALTNDAETLKWMAEHGSSMGDAEVVYDNGDIVSYIQPRQSEAPPAMHMLPALQRLSKGQRMDNALAQAAAETDPAMLPLVSRH